MARTKKDQTCTKQEDSFARHYAKQPKPKQAAELAGYAPSALRAAYKIAKRPHVIKMIEIYRRQVMRRITRDDAEVVQELADIAFQDPTSFLHENEDGLWRFKRPDELTAAQKACVRSVRAQPVYRDGDRKKEQIDTKFSYTYHDKMSALTQMGRHFGLFQDNIHVTGEMRQFKNLPQEVLLEMRESMRAALARAGSITIDGEFTNGESVSDDRRLPARS